MSAMSVLRSTEPRAVMPIELPAASASRISIFCSVWISFAVSRVKPMPDPEQFLLRAQLDSTLKAMNYVPTKLDRPSN